MLYVKYRKNRLHEEKSFENVDGRTTDGRRMPRSLISAFVVRWLDSVVSLVSLTKISSLMLAPVAE